MAQPDRSSTSIESPISPVYSYDFAPQPDELLTSATTPRTWSLQQPKPGFKTLGPMIPMPPEGGRHSSLVSVIANEKPWYTITTATPSRDPGKAKPKQHKSWNPRRMSIVESPPTLPGRKMSVTQSNYATNGGEDEPEPLPSLTFHSCMPAQQQQLQQKPLQPQSNRRKSFWSRSFLKWRQRGKNGGSAPSSSGSGIIGGGAKKQLAMAHYDNDGMVCGVYAPGGKVLQTIGHVFAPRSRYRVKTFPANSTATSEVKGKSNGAAIANGTTNNNSKNNANANGNGEIKLPEDVEKDVLNLSTQSSGAEEEDFYWQTLGPSATVLELLPSNFIPSPVSSDLSSLKLKHTRSPRKALFIYTSDPTQQMDPVTGRRRPLRRDELGELYFTETALPSPEFLERVVLSLGVVIGMRRVG